jgi:hypothetical protein
MSASELRERWLQRKLSLVPLDQSGVWRFRELLPALNDWMSSRSRGKYSFIDYNDARTVRVCKLCSQNTKA